MLARFSALLLLISAFAVDAQEPQVEGAPRAKPVSATVWYVNEPGAMNRFEDSPNASRRMVDQVVMAAAGEAEIGKAWRKLVTPKDRIGIKVNAGCGRPFSTRVSVVRAILAGLEQAGIYSKDVVVWDRNMDELREAGFDPKRLGCQVRAIDPPKGWDRTAPFSAPVLGKLIWGDLLFIEKNAKVPGKAVTDSDQLSSTSYFSTILTKDITRIINVPTLTDDAGCGVAGAMYNVGVRNLDNWRRFVAVDQSAADSIPDIYDDPNVGSKVALNIMDGMIAQYAGGPEGNPNYAFAHSTIYASRDPVAIDAVAARNIEVWRRMAKLPSIAPRLEWLKTAEQNGVGVAEMSKIKLLSVTAP